MYPITRLLLRGIFHAAILRGQWDKAPANTEIDPSMDVEIFGREIAPQLGITMRFAGEEPLDNVTNQYNDTMAKILPKYGVEFCVIPRKETGGSVISASRVRGLLKERNFAEIEKLVPLTTLEYLKRKF